VSTTGKEVVSSPAIVDSIVYVGSEDNKLYALNATNGNLIWSYGTFGGVSFSPIIANGVAYVSSSDGNVYAVGSLPVPTPSPSVPEFPSLIILPLAMITALLAVLAAKTKRKF